MKNKIQYDGKTYDLSTPEAREAFKALMEDEKRKEQDVIAKLESKPQAPLRGSIMNPLAEGAGLGYSDEFAGGVGAVASRFDPALKDKPMGEVYTGIRDQVRGDQAAFQQRNPKTAMAAETAGAILPSILTMGAAKLPSQIAAGGAMEGQAYGIGKNESGQTPDVLRDQLQGGTAGLLGGAVPAAVVGGAKAGARGVLGGTTDELFRKHVNVLDNIGVNLTVGQRSGSEHIKGYETTVAGLSGGKPLGDAIGKQRGKVQEWLMKHSGFNKTDAEKGVITRETIEAAKDNLGDKYAAALEGRKVNLGTKAFRRRLDMIESEAGRMATSADKAKVKEILQMVRSANGKLKGEDWHSLRKLARRKAGENEQNDPGMARVFTQIRKALDEAYNAALPDDQKGAWGRLQREYAGLKAINDAWKGLGGVEVARGNLPMATVLKKAKNSGVTK
ncbi:MAG: hypothetical protein U9Q81_17645, partial [Pseudomonadota bacterium]|nr:hypothetical protein [Pseudomonadota bacterium]